MALIYHPVCVLSRVFIGCSVQKFLEIKSKLHDDSRTIPNIKVHHTTSILPTYRISNYALEFITCFYFVWNFVDVHFFFQKYRTKKLIHFGFLIGNTYTKLFKWILICQNTFSPISGSFCLFGALSCTDCDCIETFDV